MTTTQEQFDNFRKDYPSHFDRYQLKIAQDSWQTCQDLNSAERESLIADNAMMREALEKITKLNDSTNAYSIARQALSTKPRLVEVGRWVEGEYEEESDFYPISYCGREGSGTMCYIIQTDTKSVAKRKIVQKGE